jgi:(1->4)-alpha-D-glucan 1-alpha-D-glucosylmutase
LIASYRLQLNAGLTFEDVEGYLDYFRELGISHLYLSPVFEARPGSLHGYDVVDPALISRELGGEKSYLRLIARARAAGIRVIQDIVPNHMAIDSLNWRLMDLLEKWEESKYFEFFDHYHESWLILPLLEEDLAEAVRKGALREDQGWLEYRGLRLPINRAGQKLLGVMGRGSGVVPTEEQILRLLDMQFYKLVRWTDYPNYRRFFAVNHLIALRIELEEVFREVHSLILRLPVDGFRVDHIDGLYDPKQYLDRLKHASGNRLVYVEKILGFDETLCKDWAADGTTGYDFLNRVNLLLIRNADRMVDIYERFAGNNFDVSSLIRKCKKHVAETLFRGDLERLSGMLGIGLEHLIDLLSEFSAYRTYVPYQDNQELRDLVARSGVTEHSVMRLQQFMPAIYAKGYEDKALFIYNPIISANEVGSDIRKLQISMEEFHSFNESRVGTLSLNATSTHDTKFSEDVRARISVISEIPEKWYDAVNRWHDNLRPRIDRSDEYRFYQTLAGSYTGFDDEYRSRIRDHMIKVVREAGLHTSWEAPNQDYEHEVCCLVDQTFTDRCFREDFLELERIIERYGYAKSLITVALKFTSPGVPDIYQGTEVWRYLLTDPDNRAQVDFNMLERLLRHLPVDLSSLELSDPRRKLGFIKRLLELRRDKSLAGYKPLAHGYQVGDVLVLFDPVVTRASEEVVSLDGAYTDIISNEKISGKHRLCELFHEDSVCVIVKQ